MTSFRDQNWNSRFGSMGDEAEQQFEQWAIENKVGFIRYGLERPPIQVHRLPAFVRFTPDYLMTSKLVEVQGFGRDQKFKLKDEKMEALAEWQTYHPVVLFAWDKTNERRFMIDLDALSALATQGEVPFGYFDQTKLYWEFSADLLHEIGELL